MAKKPSKKELGRFAAAYFGAVPEKQSMCLQLITNAVFMEEQLTKLQAEIRENGVTVTGKNGEKQDIPADSVILSAGYRPAPLAAKGRHVHIVGDAARVGNLRTVIWRAWDVAMKL